MDKLRMESPDIVSGNIDKIAALFPNCVTEALDEEHSNAEHKVYKRAINFELLKQMLSPDVVEGDERYEFTWVGKKAAIVEANKPIRKTLRPCKEESKDWDTTENLYIEGDNLEVLKLLQESYLGKVKMIYIDPPYNTGNDFIYADDFRMSGEEWSVESGEWSEDGDRLFKNTDTNGRFHSDWCSMIYSRLMLARNLLTDDGVIFISIDDNEQDNLKKICDEVFGVSNFIADIIWKRKRGRDNSARWFSKAHEYCLVYAKRKDLFNTGYLELDEETKKAYKNPDSDPRGAYRMLGCWARGTQGGVKYDFTTKDGQYFKERLWLFSKENLEKLDKEEKLIIRGDNIYRKMFIYENKGKIPETLWDDVSNAANASDEIKKIFNGIVFDTPKPTPYIKRMIELSTTADDIILDFFSGSATTAHAVMQLNAEDGGHRKFIMVQLPEKCDEQSEAYKAGYKNICEIGKERIRRAGEKILADFQGNREKGLGNRKFVGGENDSRLQGSGGLAKGHGSCEAGLSAGERTSEGRDLCTVESDEAGCGVDSVEYRGGECPEFGQRICAISEHSEGLEGGIGNATSALQGNRLSDADGNSAAARATERNRQDDKRNDTQTPKLLPTPSSLIPTLDIGFRVLKCDTSNMKDVYYAADDYSQDMIKRLESNIKEDRTDLDLLFGCLIDWGLPLSLPYKSEQIDGCTVHTYNDGDLIACFDANIPESVVKEIAKRKPLRAVFRDSGFASSPEKINVFEIFKLYMPEDAHDIGKRVRVI